jgi:hypothetical protein
MVGRSKPGLTMKRAPASIHASASSAESTVPAPTSALLPNRSTNWRMTPTAPGTVIVTSHTETPAAKSTSTARMTSSAEGSRKTGTRPTSSMW